MWRVLFTCYSVVKNEDKTTPKIIIIMRKNFTKNQRTKITIEKQNNELKKVRGLLILLLLVI